MKNIIKMVKICMVLSLIYSCSSGKPGEVKNDKNLSSQIAPLGDGRGFIQKEWTGCNNINPKDKPLCIYF